YKSFIAQRDVIFPGLGIAGSQDLFERFLNRLASFGDALANAPERRRSIVANLAIRQHAPPDGRQRLPKIPERSDARGQQGKFRRILPELPAQPSGRLEQRSRIQKL